MEIDARDSLSSALWAVGREPWDHSLPLWIWVATSCCQALCNSFLFVFLLTTWSSGFARAEDFLSIPNKEHRAWYMAGAMGYGEKQMNYKQPGLETWE